MGGGVVDPASGFVQVAVPGAKHLPASVSQHHALSDRAGQLLWQSESAPHLSTHCLAAAGGVADGAPVAVDAGSVACCSATAVESGEAHAAVRMAAERTGRM